MPAAGSLPVIEVVAAVLRDRRGRVLIAERPTGKPLAGYWEFPGGKLEPDELAAAALRRELREELGIRVQAAYRLLQFSHDYPDKRVRLDVWRVTEFDGVPAAHEGQRLDWALPEELTGHDLLPADQPIVAALRLPPLMLVTPQPSSPNEFLEALRRSLDAGIDLVQLRAPGMPAEEFQKLASQAITVCRHAGARILLNAAPELASRLGADGTHLSQARSGGLDSETLQGRHGLLGVSCHNRTEISAASSHRPDYLLVGPVQVSATHPGMAPLGWTGFAELAILSPVPVYAIGGLGLEDLQIARQHGAHGVAAIRGLWGRAQLSEAS
jgi:8-oxo-dGTP diphosphatase